MRLERFKWTVGQTSAIRKIATMSEYPTIDVVRVFYPKMGERKANSLLDKAKILRKQIASEIRQVPVGLRNSKGFGEIYLIVHESFSGWVKCGMTTNLDRRLCVYNTSDPLKRFVVLKRKEVADRRKAETCLLKLLSAHSNEFSGEWFKISNDDAVKLFEIV